jgi:hypothetical protein
MCETITAVLSHYIVCQLFDLIRFIETAQCTGIFVFCVIVFPFMIFFSFSGHTGAIDASEREGKQTRTRFFVFVFCFVFCLGFVV